MLKWWWTAMHGDYHTDRMHGFGDRYSVVEGVFREKPVSIKIKKFRREDSTSLLTRNPVKDSEEDFYHFYKKNHHLAISAQQSLFWKGWNTDVVNSIWCTKKQVPLYICMSDIFKQLFKEQKWFNSLFCFYFSDVKRRLKSPANSVDHWPSDKERTWKKSQRFWCKSMVQSMCEYWQARCNGQGIHTLSKQNSLSKT